MGKDPAFLFYPNDYLGGTLGMTFEEKGAYMELLMVQFNRGHMTSHMVGQIVGQLWVSIQDKFQIDDKGLYYNARLDIEIEKRKSFVGTRYNNLLGKNQYTKIGGHLDGHMTSHMENENRDVIIDIDNASKEIVKGKFIKPTFEEVRAYCLERDNGIDAQRFLDSNDMKGWLVGKTKTPMKDWKAAIRTWEGNNPKQNIKLGVGETMNEQGQRIYGNNRIIPNDAPPRPSSQHYWDAKCKNWGVM